MTNIEGAMDAVGAALKAGGSRAEMAKRVADAIRFESGYRWVGVYEIGEKEVTVIGWTGTEEPAFSRFPVNKGITATVIGAKAPVVVADVTKDARYLVAFSNMRSEMIVPVMNGAGKVIGTIGAESERVGAFSEADVRFLQACASASTPLFESRTGQG